MIGNKRMLSPTAEQSQEKEKENAGTSRNSAEVSNPCEKAKHTSQTMSPKSMDGPRWTPRLNQVGMNRTMEKESRKARAAKEESLKEKGISPQATPKAMNTKGPLKPTGEERKDVSKETAKERLTSRQMRRKEQMLPQRLIVRHGKANLKNYIRNIGTRVDCTAGTPKTVLVGVNGLCQQLAALSSWNITSPQKPKTTLRTIY